MPPPEWHPSEAEKYEENQKRHERTRDKFRDKLKRGELEESQVELSIEQRQMPVQVFSNMGMEQMDMDLQGMFEKLIPKLTADGLARLALLVVIADTGDDKALAATLKRHKVNLAGVRAELLAEQKGKAEAARKASAPKAAKAKPLSQAEAPKAAKKKGGRK